jgi:1-acyl-sn-glycerol-3-phosphate acyltransferase
MIQLHSSFETSLETSTITKVAPLRSRVAPWLAPLLYFLGRRLVFPLYFGRISVTGQENIPTNGPVILAPTHRSRWDGLLIPAATGRGVTGRDPRFMVSANEVTGLQGWFIRRMGGFPVDTDRPSITTLRHGVDILQQGETLVIFPEGGNLRENRNCQINRLQPGLARLALQAESSRPNLGIKIVPISICYGNPTVPWRCQVKICIGSPLRVADYSTGSVKQNAKHLTADLEAALKELNNRCAAGSFWN